MKQTLKNTFLAGQREYFELAFLTYLGGKDYITKMLIKHAGEKDTHYAKRLEIAHNINIVDKIIGILSSFVLSNVERVIGIDEDVIKEYTDAIDLEQSLEEFLERKIAEYLLMDNAFTVVDSNGSRAYCHDVNYLDLFDWKKKEGVLEYLDIALGDRVARISAEDYKFTSFEKYFEEKGPHFTLKPVENSINEIPFVRVNAKLDVKTAYFRDAIYNQKSVFNHYNNIDQQLLDTGNTILAIPGAKNKEYDPQTDRVINYLVSSPVIPHFISPDTSHLEFYLNYIIHIIEQLLNSLNIYRESKSDTQTSGLSKSYDYSIMAESLKKLSAKMERFELEMWKMIAKYDDRIKIDKIEVKYRKDFDLKSLAEQIDLVLRVSSLQISNTLSKEMEKKLSSKFIENDAILQKVHDEIDAKNFDVTVVDELKNIKDKI